MICSKTITKLRIYIGTVAFLFERKVRKNKKNQKNPKKLRKGIDEKLKP